MNSFRCLLCISVAALVMLPDLGAAEIGSSGRPDRGADRRPDTRLPGSTLGVGDLAVGEPGGLPSGAGVDAPASRTVNFPNTLPSAELRPSATMPGTPARDLAAAVIGQSDGDVLVLIWEDSIVQSMTSTDGGANFSAEVQLPTTPAGARVLYAWPDLDTGSDVIYVGTGTADPNGDIGLQVTTSTDFGSTWNTPVLLTQKGDDTHGVGDARLDGNGGTAAVVYREQRGGDLYARVTTDSGGTWSSRVRVNTGPPDGQGPLDEGFAVQVDAAGRVHVAFIEDRGSGRQMFYTRSTDSGASFEAVRNFDGLLSLGRTRSANPEIREANNGNILITFWDSAGSDVVYVLRSVDGGATFAEELSRAFADEGDELLPSLFASDANNTVVLHVVDGAGNLTTQASIDGGATWGLVQTVVGSAAGHSDVGRDQAAMARTSAGTYAIAWTDDRSDSYLGNDTDLFVSFSADGGILDPWSAENRVDRTPAGDSGTADPSISGVNADDVILVYPDVRDNQANGWNVYSNRSGAAAPDFTTNEQRIDADSGNVDANVFNAQSVAVGDSALDGGVQDVYVAIPGNSTGPHPGIWFARSSDGGYSFGPAVQVSATTGSEFAGLPNLDVAPDGTVHVAYAVLDSATDEWDLRYNKSDDGGTTWGTEIDFGPMVVSEFDLLVPDNTSVVLAWADSNGTDILTARSADGGDTFGATTTLNSNTTNNNRNPLLCAADGTLFALFAAPDVQFQFFTSFVSFSEDGGANWSVEEQVLPDGSSGGSFLHTLDCFVEQAGDGVGDRVASLLMTDERSGTPLTTLRGYRVSGGVGTFVTPPFSGGPGAGSELVGGIDCDCCGNDCAYSFSRSVNDPRGLFDTTYAGVADVLAGTASFQDITADTASGAGVPLPAAVSDLPLTAADGQGNVWVFWLDQSAGHPEVVARLSTDDGQNYGDAYRVSRHTPQGTGYSSIFFSWRDDSIAAADGEAFFVWSAVRESPFFSGLINVWDTDDFDRDTFVAGADCLDSDPDVHAVPVAVADLAVDKDPGGALLSWTSQDGSAGTATSYDVTSTPLSDLLDTGAYGMASCIQDDQTDTPYLDSRADPPAGEAYAYLVRAQNPCGTATYGDSNGPVPDPRDDLDSTGPCP